MLALSQCAREPCIHAPGGGGTVQLWVIFHMLSVVHVAATTPKYPTGQPVVHCWSSCPPGQELPHVMFSLMPLMSTVGGKELLLHVPTGDVDTGTSMNCSTVNSCLLASACTQRGEDTGKLLLTE